MNELFKIRDISTRYEISARTLRYYEDMGLINSTRSDDYAYRMYDEASIKRLEQILILRKLNISIKDIQRIFDTSGSEVVLEVLGKKVDDIDDEVSLLHELKDVVLEFIHQIEKSDFGNDSEVKLLYEKAREIENQLVNVEYKGNPANMNRLVEVTEKLKKAPEVRIVQLPKCKMATSGTPDHTFSTVWDFPNWWEDYDKKRHGVHYAPLDFLFGEDGGLVWWMMVEDGATNEDCGGYDIFDFEGGLYAVHTSVDEDMESQNIVNQKIIKWLENTGFELDERHGNRTYMGHMVNPSSEIKQGLGYNQYEIFVPIKLKEK